MPAENHGLDILHRNTERVGQEAPVAGGVQHPGHPDHALPGEAGDFLGDPAHHVQRVGNHDDDGARRMPPDLLAYRFHDFDIGPYQVVAAHPRLPGDAGGDDKEIAASGHPVVIGSHDSRVEPLDRSRFPLVQPLALRDSVDDVHQHDLAAELLLGDALRHGRAHVPGAHNGDLLHRRPIRLLDGGCGFRPPRAVDSWRAPAPPGRCACRAAG